MEGIFVVGAGGIGCAVGYALCASGRRVTFVDADPDKVRWGRTHGVRVDRAPPRAAEFQTFDEWAPPPGATVLLCTKCYDNARVLVRLPSPVTLIPIQNGFDPSLDAHAQAFEGIASFVSECYAHRTHTRVTRGGRLHFGARGSQAGEGAEVKTCREGLLRALALARARTGALTKVRVKVVPDILPYKYTKLMYNAAISPLAAAAGLDNGQLLAVPRARRLFFALLHENYGILRDAGIRLGKIGPFHPDTVHRILSRAVVANALAWLFYPTLRRSYCSMSADLPAGRTEIDYYNRHLIELAGDRPCPLNRRVYQLILRMESERIPPAAQVLDELL